MNLYNLVECHAHPGSFFLGRLFQLFLVLRGKAISRRPLLNISRSKPRALAFAAEIPITPGEKASQEASLF